MEQEKLYNFYDKVFDCLVKNTYTMIRHNHRKGYYIPDFDFNNKIDLLMVEVIKIANLFDGDNMYPILFKINSIPSFFKFLKLKFRLRNSNLNVKRLKSEVDINYDIIENLEFVSKELNFPIAMYEEIYDAFYGDNKDEI